MYCSHITIQIRTTYPSTALARILFKVRIHKQSLRLIVDITSSTITDHNLTAFGLCEVDGYTQLMRPYKAETAVLCSLTTSPDGGKIHTNLLWLSTLWWFLVLYILPLSYMQSSLFRQFEHSWWVYYSIKLHSRSSELHWWAIIGETLQKVCSMILIYIFLSNQQDFIFILWINNLITDN